MRTQLAIYKIADLQGTGPICPFSSAICPYPSIPLHNI